MSKFLPRGKEAIEKAREISFEGIRIANQWRTPRLKYPGLPANRLPFTLGDHVIAVRGDCKGKAGNIVEIKKKTGEVIVDGVNMVEEMVTERVRGQEIEKLRRLNKPLPIVDLRLVNPRDSKPSDLYFKNNQRICARTHSTIPYPTKINPLIPPVDQKASDSDTLAHIAQLETFSLDQVDPWTPPIPLDYKL